MTDLNAAKAQDRSIFGRGEAWDLFLISPVALVSAWFFEWGYLYYFNVPNDVIQLDAVRIANGVLCTLALVFLLSWVAMVIRGLRNSPNLVIKMVGLSFNGIFVISATLLWLYLPVAEEISRTSGNLLYIPLVLLFFAYPILISLDSLFPSKGDVGRYTYRERLAKRISLGRTFFEEAAAIDEETIIPMTKTTPDRADRAWENIKFIAFAMLASLFLIHGVGYKAASLKRTFSEVCERPGLIAIAQYGEVMVYKEYDDAEETFKPSFFLRKLSEASFQKFRRRAIDFHKPLKIESTRSI